MIPEIDGGEKYIGLKEALEKVLTEVSPVGVEVRGIPDSVGCVLAEDVQASVNSPTDNMSLKDGYAVKSGDVQDASPEKPVRLKIVGSGFAGHGFEGELKSGSAVKIMSGSPLPSGADSVISGELVEENDGEVQVKADARQEQNVFPAGGDLKACETIALKGDVLLPARLSLIAAGGIDRVKVYRKPKVALIGIGDEVVAPGRRLKQGQVYASNLVNQSAWLSAYGIEFNMDLAADSLIAIKKKIKQLLPYADIILTSGGAWGSERDMVVGSLDELGWRKIFHHVRIGPGKGTAFGILEKKPVFCLPGGPPSNQMAFLQLALPAVLKMAGRKGHPLITVPAALTADIVRRHKAWTEFRSGKLSRSRDGNFLVEPFTEVSRLKSMAATACLISIPEGVDSLNRDQRIEVQLMVPALKSEW